MQRSEHGKNVLLEMSESESANSCAGLSADFFLIFDFQVSGKEVWKDFSLFYHKNGELSLCAQNTPKTTKNPNTAKNVRAGNS